jgi:hypothetical protein
MIPQACCAKRAFDLMNIRSRSWNISLAGESTSAVGRLCADARASIFEEVKMASNEFRPAGAEGNSWHPEVASTLVHPGWVGVAHEIAGSRLDNFLYAGKPRSAQAEPEAVSSAPVTDTMPPALADDCPHCAVHLSAVELKMERCLSCGRSLRRGAGLVNSASTISPLTIGI